MKMRMLSISGIKDWLPVKTNLELILSVAVMSQIGILTPDWSIAAVPSYSPE